jgi:hypothetical protein
MQPVSAARSEFTRIWPAALRISIYSQRVQDRDLRERSAIMRSQSSRALTAIGILLFFGAVMACLAGTTLLWRGTVLDRMWVLNPVAYKRLVTLSGAAGVMFLLLGAALAVAGTGWFKRRLWGWRLAVVIIAVQVLGDLVNVLRGDIVRGAIGFTIAGGLLFYLLCSKEVRAAFVRGHMTNPR